MCAYVCFLNLKVFLYNSVKPEPQRGVLVVWTLQGIQYQKSRCSWCSFFSLRYHKSMGCFIQQWRPIKKWLFWEKCFKASRLLRQANSENVAHYKSPKGKNCYVVCFSRTRKSNPAWGFEHPKEVELTSTWVFLVADTLNFLCFNPLALQMWHSETLDGGFNVFSVFQSRGHPFHVFGVSRTWFMQFPNIRVLKPILLTFSNWWVPHLAWFFSSQPLKGNTPTVLLRCQSSWKWSDIAAWWSIICQPHLFLTIDL